MTALGAAFDAKRKSIFCLEPPGFGDERKAVADALRAIQDTSAMAGADTHNVRGGHQVPNDDIWSGNANWSLALVNAVLDLDINAEFVEVEVEDDDDEGEEDGETIVYGDGLGGGMGGDDGMGGGGMGGSGVVA